MSLRMLSAALAFGIGLVGTAVGASAAVAVESARPVHVAIAVPITIPANSGSLISADALEQYTSPMGTLSRQLDAAIDRPVALGIDPRIIVSIRILGSSAPVTATAWLERLAGASNDTFPLAYADSDLTLATQAGSAAVLESDGFDFAIDPALFTESSATGTPTLTPSGPPGISPPPSPTPTQPVEPVIPALPTTDDLVAWPYTLTGVAWPVDATAIASDLPVITASGYSTTILSSRNLARDPGAGALADVGGSRVLVSEDSVSTPLANAIRSTTATGFQLSVSEMSAAIDAVGVAQSGSTATLFATLDRTALLAGNRLSDAIAAMQANPNVTMVSMTTALVGASATATVIDQPRPAERVALMRQLLEAQAAESQFASIASDPRAITSARRLELLALTAGSWNDNPTGWPVAVAEGLAASLELRSSVQVASTGDFNFLAAEAPLPIAVTNNLDQAVTVFVTVRPDTGLLSVGDSRVELLIEPDSQSSAKIPAQAVSNGVVGVTVSLSSATGVPIGDVSRASINVQAGWETPVVIVIASLVVAVFGGGVVRNILRLRKGAAARGISA